jgi:hypothetical protein
MGRWEGCVVVAMAAVSFDAFEVFVRAHGEGRLSCRDALVEVGVGQAPARVR